MRSRVYLDHAATTPLSQRVLDAMMPFLSTDWGNPSSLHQEGRQGKKALDTAREQVASYFESPANRWTFTASGTEANNTLLNGWASQFQHRPHKHLITTAMEHPCVLNPIKALQAEGWEVSFVPLESDGRITQEALISVLRPETCFASLMHGNNEIGTLQNLAELAQVLQPRGVWFHTDAVQTVGKVPISLKNLPVNALSLSAHKLYGPKGVGALYVQENTPLFRPLILGGGQEFNRRSGTENVAGIVGLAEALAETLSLMETETPRLHAFQQQLIRGIEHQIPEAHLNGPRDLERRVPGNVNFSFPPIQGESLVVKLDMKGYAVSSGSACHSAVIEPSHVLLAVGENEEIARSSLRFSLGRATQAEDIDQLLNILPTLLEKARPKTTPEKPTPIQ